MEQDNPDRIAGVALDWHDPYQGWVGTLGVLRDYRRRGLAEALLRESFGAFWRSGERKVVLGVDAQSLTGAVRLYERVGMRSVRQWDSFSKELRAGRDLATLSLDGGVIGSAPPAMQRVGDPGYPPRGEGSTEAAIGAAVKCSETAGGHMCRHYAGSGICASRDVSHDRMSGCICAEWR